MVKQKIPFGDIQSMHKSKIFTGKMGFVALWVCSLYPGLPVIFFPTQNFKSWAVWQNENHSVPARVNLLESVIEAVRSVRALSFGLLRGQSGSGNITEKL